MVSSKRPQLSVSIDSSEELVARTPPPAFLFPDQRFQRPRPEEPAPLFSAGERRRRRCSRLSLRCQAPLKKKLFQPVRPGGRRRRRCSRLRFPRQVVLFKEEPFSAGPPRRAEGAAV